MNKINKMRIWVVIAYLSYITLLAAHYIVIQNIVNINSLTSYIKGETHTYLWCQMTFWSELPYLSTVVFIVLCGCSLIKKMYIPGIRTVGVFTAVLMYFLVVIYGWTNYLDEEDWCVNQFGAKAYQNNVEMYDSEYAISSTCDFGKRLPIVHSTITYYQIY